MKHEAQVEQLRKIFGYLDAGETAMGDAVYHHHVSDYTSPDQADREREVLFRDEPLLIGLSCELPNPGDYVTDDFSGVPILAVRDEAGQVNAFINVCRHRGARVASGCGSGKAMVQLSLSRMDLRPERQAEVDTVRAGLRERRQNEQRLAVSAGGGEIRHDLGHRRRPADRSTSTATLRAWRTI